MNIEGVIWLRTVIDKLAFKHHVEVHEVEELFAGEPRFRHVERGERKSEDVYMALGRTDAGRYLTVVFIHKNTREALILSAREWPRKREKCMAENNSQKLPPFGSLDEMVEFFDTHDMGAFEEELPEANFEVDLRTKTHLVAIDEETNNRLTEIAEQERTPAESLVNSWLKEKISRYPKQA
jgi:uncharacterized DUF497 family protein